MADAPSLPPTFTFAEGVRVLGERGLRRVVAAGQVERLARGVYRRADVVGDEDLSEISLKAPQATICGMSALSMHGLSDEIPLHWEVAIPRGAWAPVTQVPVTWRRFDARTFDIGREVMDLADGSTMGVYSAARSIVDAFRLRHLDGDDVAYEALRRWIRNGGQSSMLLEMTRSFPKVLPVIRHTLQVLL